MPDWSIKIVLDDKGKTWFLPDLQGGKGEPLNAQQDDLVSWNNTTEDTHQPWPTNDQYNPVDPSTVPRGSATYMSDPIPAGDSSRPAYDTSQLGTIYYCCLIHQTELTERGTIIVSAVPT
jgi:hypothetical protein